jgi:hypothetical protein
MRFHDDHEPAVRDLARLRPLVPDPSHAARVRAKCHARLAQAQRRRERTALLAESTRRVLAPAVLGSVCATYVAAFVGTVVGLRESIFRW